MMEMMATIQPVDEGMEKKEEELQLVSFHVGMEEYAIDILGVQEIIRMIDLTPVPNAAHYVEGVINLRGKVIPIVNLRTRFGLPPAGMSKDRRIIVLDIASIILGFIVDSVSEVLRVPGNLIQPPSSMGTHGGAEFHKGVGRVDGRLLILLDLEQLLGLGSVV